MKRLIVIKLGGSIVTYKDSPTPKARISVIKRLAREIKQLFDQGYRLILVHGAGYVHKIVKEGNIQFGMETSHQKLAFSNALNSMQGLNNLILKYLLDAKLPAVGLSPHNFAAQSAGELFKLNTRIIKNFLNNGQIPLISPDMVLDDKWGCSVLSGDTIVCYLGNKLKADKVIFLSDVDGIYTSDPKKNPYAKLITKVTNKSLESILKGLTPNNPNDTSGEMKGKILEIKRNLKGIDVYIAKGLKNQILRGIIRQENIGSRIRF